MMTASAEPSSIYDRTPTASTDRASRTARRAREADLDADVPSDRPPARPGPGFGWKAWLDAQSFEPLTRELEALERWAEQRSEADRMDGATIRRALAYLRRLGRLSAGPLPELPPEERSRLVRLLSLEHRWCYAAAGTNRSCFERAIGRTGAR